MFIDSADPVPAAPLDETVGPVDIKSLLSIPVQRPGQILKLLRRTELVTSWQDVPLKGDGTGYVSDSNFETLQWQRRPERLAGRERIPRLDLLSVYGYHQITALQALKVTVKDNTEMLDGLASKGLKAPTCPAAVWP